MVKKENYDKFIFKGSLALESYVDDMHENLDMFNEFNEAIKKYRSKKCKTNNDKEMIVKNLLCLIKKIGEDKFNIYDDGDIEYIGNKKEGVDF